MRVLRPVVIGPGKQRAAMSLFSAYLAVVYADVGPISDLVVLLMFNTGVVSSDFSLGFDIKVNGVSQTIVSTYLWLNQKILEITLDTFVAFGDTVTISYDDTVGDIHTLLSISLASFTDMAVINNVLMHILDYSRADNSMYLGLIRRV